VRAHGGPLLRIKKADLARVGVDWTPDRTTSVADGQPVLGDGRRVEVANVIWCTGFRQDFGWIDVPVFDGDGEPLHEGGVASEPRLYFLGLDFLYAFTSENVGGVGRDARRLARQIGKR
jgi:putative flavoprotein involved in K+ transport